MYCGSCREERLGTAKWCVICGSKLSERTRAQTEEALGHMQFLLAEVRLWKFDRLPADARRQIEQEYLRKERLLLKALELPEQETLSEVIQALPLPPREPARPPEEVPRAPVAAPRHQPATVEASLPEHPSEALLDVPHAETPAKTAVEAVSTWNSVWKPFLYESVGWFIGAFLIVAGTFYFVAESWAGMSSSKRSLVVFGVTAGYAAGFSFWGRFFSRKPTLASAGRILELIGAAVAPFAGLALYATSLAPPLWFWPLAGAWSVAAAWLVRHPAQRFHAGAVGPLQVSMALTTLILAAAPALAGFGAAAIWANALPILMVWLTFRASATDEQGREALVFTLLGHAYLAALFALRLHIALIAVGAMPPLGTYAPFVAALLGAGLRARKQDPSRAADPLSVGVIALQLACCPLAAFGNAPAFFVSCAVTAVTAWSLSRGNAKRARWLYPAYAAAYFSYQSVGQLVPGPVRLLLVRVKQALGYAEGRALPFNYDAVYAVPFVLAFAVVASRLMKSARGDEPGPKNALQAEVLLRSTAVASGLLAALAMAGSDMRPALWSIPVLAALCVGLGLWLDRRSLSWTGGGLAMLTPVFTAVLFSPSAGALASAAVGGAFTLLALAIPRNRPHGRTAAALGLSVAAAGLAWVPPFHFAGGLALLAASAGMAGLGLRWPHPQLRQWSAALGVSAIPLIALLIAPRWAPLALAMGALALAGLSELRVAWRPLSWVAAVASVSAMGWTLGVQFNSGPTAPGLGLVAVAGFVSAMICARRRGGFGVLGALFLGVALFPPIDFLVTFPGLTPQASGVAYAAVSLASSVWGSRRGRSLAAGAFAVVSVLGALGAAAVLASDSSSFPGLLIAALTALFTAGAIHPRFSLPLSAALSLGAAGAGPELAYMALPAVFTGLACLDEWPRLRHQLVGSAQLGTVGSVCALATGVGVGFIFIDAPHVSWVLIAQAVVFPAVWLRVSRRPLFALAWGPCVVAATHFGSGWVAWPGLAAGVMVLFTRGLRHAPRVGRWLRLEEASQQDAAFLFAWVGLWSATGVQLALHWASPGPRAWEWGCVAAALLLGAGGQVWIRLIAAAALALFVPEVRWVAPWVLLALGFAAHHFPEATHRALGAPKSPLTLRVAAWAAVLLGAFDAAIRLSLTGSPGGLIALTAVLFAAAFLVSQRWLLTFVPLVGALALSLGGGGFHAHPESGFVLAALCASAAQALCRIPSLQRRLAARASGWAPSFEAGWSQPVWWGGFIAALAPVAAAVMDAQGTPPQTRWAAFGSAALLLFTTDRVEAVLASLLLGASAWICVPAAWAPVALASTGLTVCALGVLLRAKVRVADALHEAGWALTLTSLIGLSDLGHPATPLCAGLCALVAWLVARRRPALEPVSWGVTLLALHVGVLHLGIRFSTGKPHAFIFPYLGFASAACATVALWCKPTSVRRRMGHAIALVALIEVGCGLAFISEPATREAGISAFGLAALLATLIRLSLREQDEPAAYLGQVALVLSYGVVRFQAMGAALSGVDALAALLAGVAFSGLYVWARRQAGSGQVLVRPAALGAVLLPLVGLVAAPWSSPLVVAALLVGHATHFAAFARTQGQRRWASLLSAAAFNAALVCTWVGTSSAHPQYFVLPAALSMLALVHVFRGDLSLAAQARLRAVAITALYAASAWEPLVFESGWAMLVCVLVCVLGVAAGIGLRIRSFIYLGSAFMVTTVATNLVRFGVQHHRAGALFLSVLGLSVVAFMVVLSARRAELMQRYERVRAAMQEWQA